MVKEPSVKTPFVTSHAVVSNILAAGMSAISLATCDFVLKKAHPTEVDYDIIGAILGVWISLKSGFPSTNVKLSLLTFRSCSRTRKPATTMPLRFTLRSRLFG